MHQQSVTVMDGGAGKPELMPHEEKRSCNCLRNTPSCQHVTVTQTCDVTTGKYLYLPASYLGQSVEAGSCFLQCWGTVNEKQSIKYSI